MEITMKKVLWITVLASAVSFSTASLAEENGAMMRSNAMMAPVKMTYSEKKMMKKCKKMEHKMMKDEKTKEMMMKDEKMKNMMMECQMMKDKMMNAEKSN